MKRRRDDDTRRDRAPRPKKRIRKQKEYHSSSDESEEENDTFQSVNLQDSEEETSGLVLTDDSLPQIKSTRATSQQSSILEDDEPNSTTDAGSDADSDSEDDDDESGNPNLRRLSKRNDPDAFATSISKILSTKLSQNVRSDPVLSRSREATKASTETANERLEKKVKAKLKAEKKEDLQRGRVKDVLGLTTGDAGEVAEEEKRLRKIAQRGVVKLFNAVRAAQVKADEAAREERKKGTIGTGARQEKINEMSKQGFLDLISGEDKKTVET